jgi:hypothetical protein
MQLLPAAALALLGAVMAWTWLLVPPRSGVTKENYERLEEEVSQGDVERKGRGQDITFENSERIHDGMTLPELEAILGGPPGDYRTQDREPREFQYTGIQGTLRTWLADDGIVLIWFDAKGRVCGIVFREGPGHHYK